MGEPGVGGVGAAGPGVPADVPGGSADGVTCCALPVSPGDPLGCPEPGASTGELLGPRLPLGVSLPLVPRAFPPSFAPFFPLSSGTSETEPVGAALVVLPRSGPPAAPIAT
ncbi:hypothetical protein AQI95_00420 [Streptomyces yokosukanensis]|uniref:Uncharacterized protein n=1 Tax=Streptomyces yokosukanensis TaxID=67386 RepID=A0A124HHI2_9ACTN|nr:hypothetical protein AQI95_00420 [Streptomyces yokosukanensis]